MDEFTWFLVGVVGGAVTALALGYVGLAWYMNRNPR